MTTEVSKSQIRYWGAGAREQLAGVFYQFGNEAGYNTAERFVYEIASFVAEVKGREIAADMCLRVGDAVLGGSPPGDAVVALQDDPNAPAVLHIETDGGAAAFLEERIADTVEWLRRHGPQYLQGAGPKTDAERVIWRAAYLACLRDLASHMTVTT
jgi:hypothetical protein